MPAIFISRTINLHTQHLSTAPFGTQLSRRLFVAFCQWTLGPKALKLWPRPSPITALDLSGCTWLDGERFQPTEALRDFPRLKKLVLTDVVTHDKPMEYLSNDLVYWTELKRVYKAPVEEIHVDARWVGNKGFCARGSCKGLHKGLVHPTQRRASHRRRCTPEREAAVLSH